MIPRKSEHLIANFKIPYSEETDADIDDSGLDKMRYDQQRIQFRARIRKSDLDGNREVILRLIAQALDHYSRAG